MFKFINHHREKYVKKQVSSCPYSGIFYVASTTQQMGSAVK